MTSAIPFTDLAASDRPLQPGECAALAERAAGLLDPAALALARAGASVVLWEDEHSVSWLNAMPERRDTGYHDHDGSAAGRAQAARDTGSQPLLTTARSAKKRFFWT
jgi:hypothetical protein